MTRMYQPSSNRKTPYEIGSYFCFGKQEFNHERAFLNPLDSSYTYFSTCRSAIDLILSRIDCKTKKALLPAFTCHAVVEPFVIKGFKVAPYTINKDFSTSIEEFIETVEKEKPGVILLHDYFGFDTNKELRNSGVIESIITQGIVVIVDQTQSMFSDYEQLHGNYVVGSIRKWMGIPDGAFSNVRAADLIEDSELVLAKSEAMNYKYAYLIEGTGEKGKVLPLYRKAENILDSRNDSFAMSEISKIIFQNTDIEQLKKRRIENYKCLLRGIESSEKLVVPHQYLEAETPFYFPVFCKSSRSAFQTYLAKYSVYATVIWGCPDEFVNLIDQRAKDIYQEILCIPCDQRYDSDDMKYICNLINDFQFS